MMIKRLIDNPTYPVVMISIILLGALFLSVAGCAPAPPYIPLGTPTASAAPPSPPAPRNHPVWDMWGHRYPELCRQAKSNALVTVVIERMPDDEKTGIPRLGAYWAPGVRGPVAVLGIDSSISDKMTQFQILLHERCHHIMWELTGSADWHR